MSEKKWRCITDTAWFCQRNHVVSNAQMDDELEMDCPHCAADAAWREAVNDLLAAIDVWIDHPNESKQALEVARTAAVVVHRQSEEENSDD